MLPSIYTLQDGEYVKTEVSKWLPNLDLRHLEECLMMDSQLDSILAFQERYK
jgi:hypothetical protein